MEQINEQQAEQLAKRVEELEAENAELRNIIKPDGKTLVQRAIERQKDNMRDEQEYRKQIESNLTGKLLTQTNDY